ncbi:MAG: tryptophan synthase subunit alpha [Actinomycetota bacterium]|nr:tryptophan synthase subunit alpha [Actinomycetota bacterium]
MTISSAGPLESALRARRDAGAKLLVPYVTGGLDDDWVSTVEAVAAAGADAIEIGIPFSDPVMDGPVIQEASARALARSVTPTQILAEIAQVHLNVPLTVMTYYNLVFRAGLGEFAGALAASGIAGAIVPDLPLEELDDWAAAAGEAGVETILLAAPTTDDDRLVQICQRSRGWVYGVGVMGVTGERTGLAASATLMGKRLRAATDKPVLIGVGVSTPEQAVEACEYADGVIVGSALVRRLLEGSGPEGAARFVAELRAGLDGESSGAL